MSLPLQRHSVAKLQTAWNCAQLGLFVFPLIPWLGSLGIVFALVSTWQQQFHKIIHRPRNWGLAIVASLLVITTGFALDRWVAFLGLFNFLPFFGLFAAFSALIQTPAQLRQLAWIMIVTSVPVVMIGLGQLFLDWVSPDRLQAVLGWELQSKGNPTGRMASVFMYANVLAGYLVIVYILGLGLWIETYQSARQTGRMHRTRVAPHLPCLFLSVTIIGIFVALILTNSRNAWAIAVCASLAFALYQGWRWLVAGVAGVAGSVLLAAFGPSPLQQWLRTVVPAFFWARLTDQLYPDRPVVLLRTTQWQFAWSLTTQRPWTGWGLRNFTPIYETQMHVWLGHPHNFLLMLTAETGLPTAVLFCGWVSWVILEGVFVLRNWSIGVAGRQAQDRLIFFSYLVAFLACVLFNTVDVSLFDLRLNILGWLLLSAICGVSRCCKYTQ